MKPVNLISVLIANKSLSVGNRDSLYSLWGIKPKPKELVSLDSFVNGVKTHDPHSPERVAYMMGGCYFGFVITRISKEFDCLWIGDKTVIDVELKSQDVGTDAIQKQLVQNRHYLSPLGLAIASFTFDSSTGNCYTLDVSGNLVNSSLSDITKAIYDVHNEKLYEGEIETLFPPERYLVSPFNSTTEFMNGLYFLTDQQEDIKRNILNFVSNASAGSFCALTGGPGTGKTLMLYDMAQTLAQSGLKVVIGHAGVLNNGHTMLINNKWNICYTRDMIVMDMATQNRKLREADVYMIDEAQRCYNLDTIVAEIQKSRKKCIFSYDADQVMKDNEQRRDNPSKISALVGAQKYVLTSNVRTNAAVYTFVKALFNKRDQTNDDIKGHVDITYCQTKGEACVALRVLKGKGYRVPNFTPIQYGREDYQGLFPDCEPSAHEVIGQEFDNVASMLSENMYYDANNKLVSRNTSYLYREDKMLYQILSRARRRIHLVIVNNPTMLERCLKLLKK